MAKFLILEIPSFSGIRLKISFPFPKRDIVMGRVTEGVLKPGMKLTVENKVMEIDRIEAKHKEWEEANVGDEVALIIKNGDIKILEKLVDKEVEFSI